MNLNEIKYCPGALTEGNSTLFPSLENHTTISLQKYTTLMQG